MPNFFFFTSSYKTLSHLCVIPPSGFLANSTLYSSIYSISDVLLCAILHESQLCSVIYSANCFLHFIDTRFFVFINYYIPFYTCNNVKIVAIPSPANVHTLKVYFPLMKCVNDS